RVDRFHRDTKVGLALAQKFNERVVIVNAAQDFVAVDFSQDQAAAFRRIASRRSRSISKFFTFASFAVSVASRSAKAAASTVSCLLISAALATCSSRSLANVV